MGCSLWYEAKIRRNGEESKGLGHLFNCPSEVCHELVHFGSVDGGIVPGNTVASDEQVATDLPLGHTTDELAPGVLSISGELHTGAGGVVQELIVLDPEGGVPGFVVGVTVHGGSFG